MWKHKSDIKKSIYLLVQLEVCIFLSFFYRYFFLIKIINVLTVLHK